MPGEDPRQPTLHCNAWQGVSMPASRDEKIRKEGEGGGGGQTNRTWTLTHQ